MPIAWALVLGPGAAISCTGTIPDGAGGDNLGGMGGPGGPGPSGTNPGVTKPGDLPGAELAASSRLRRLTVDEYNRTVSDLLGDNMTNAGQVLPGDARAPFDNDFTTQVVSATLISGTELLAGDVASRLLADKSRRDRVVGCTPAGPTDSACLKGFITRFGRLAWRRALTGDDVQTLMKLQALAVQDNDFYSAIDGVIRSVLNDPEFLFRVETGTQVAPGLFRLTGPELATRLSYFLLGTSPDDQLLTLAENGGLDTPDKVRSVAITLLGKPSALPRVTRFHAMWMNYEHLPASPLAAAMKRETDTLMSQLLFKTKAPWQDLLRSKETYVSYDLAAHYGLTPPATLKKGTSTFAWVPYTGTKRQGLLSHATFLQLGVKNGDTHPVLRGKGIRELMFCQPPPEKPANVAAGMTTDSPCKKDKLLAHATGSCAGCHALMDPVGFGLENYDDLGRFRQYDRDPITGKDLTQCRISGDGVLDGQKFNGPAELADLMLASPLLNQCATKQLYRFAMGRTAVDATDKAFLEAMAARMGQVDFRFDELLLDFVSSGAFAHRRAEP